MTGTVTHPEWLSTDRGIRDQWSRVCEISGRQSFFHDVKLGDRLERLFAVACCREIWPLLTDARSRNAVEVAERYADGLTTVAELNAAYAAAMTAARATTNDATWAAARAATNDAAWGAAYAAWGAAYAAAYAATNDATNDATYAAAKLAAIATQGRILVTFIAPEWEWQVEWGTGDVIAIARQMYDSRDFSAMPILADALTDAGCEDERLLSSLRNTETPWYRGCRILDCAIRRHLLGGGITCRPPST